MRDCMMYVIISRLVEILNYYLRHTTKLHASRRLIIYSPYDALRHRRLSKIYGAPLKSAANSFIYLLWNLNNAK